MTDAPGSLGGLGLDADEEKLYRRLVEEGPADAGPDPAAARLRALGLADEADGLLTAVSPQLALTELMLTQERAVLQARAGVEELTEIFRRRTATAGPALEVVRGRERVGRLIQHRLRGARGDVRFFAKPPFAVIGVQDTSDADEADLSRRGVRERLVIERAVLNEPGAPQEIRASLDRGQEIRFTPELPCKLLITDDDLAVVQLDASGGDRDGVLLVRPGGLLTSLITLFELQWERAVRLREDGAGRLTPSPATADELPDEEDRRLLALLLAGHTDASAAHHTGLGRRTVQRRIRRLMDLAGTDSRIQLGWYARDRGWL
ncbi:MULTISPECIES: hypothetical protein [unclassified Streptomyces]|uniref:hypothetical protein n=1 Tax=unclassified Streptomyces TaxID=2593676 RepID=UPI00363F64ED